MYKPSFTKPKVQLGAMAGVAPLLSAGGSIVSSLIGARQNAAAMGLAQAQFNRQMMLAQEQFQEQKRIAGKQEEFATAGTQDARGNKTRYVPGVGWISDPTPRTKALLAASDAEEGQRLTTDASRVRRGKQANERSRLQEGRLADTYRRQLINRTGEVSPDQMRSRMAEVMLADNAERGDQALNAIGMDNARAGTRSNLADDIMSKTSAGTRTALARARMDAPIQANENNQNIRNALLNSYNLMATRAGNAEDMPFQPTNVESVPAGNITRSMAVGPYSMAGASASIGRGAGDTSTMTGRGYDALMNTFNINRKNQPDYGLMIGGLSEGLQNLLRGFGGSSTSKNENPNSHGAF